MCTIFATNCKKEMILAKNYDCFIRGGMIFTNKRNMKKYSLVMPPEIVFRWESIYGSITFSQSGKGMPASGINEKGLIVEQATNPTTVYQRKGNTPRISCLEATQFLLDTCENVEQAIKSFNQFRISPDSGKVHFFLADSKGKKVIIEFFEGKIVIFQNDKMVYPILTNTDYRLPYKDSKEEIFENAYAENSFRRFCIVKEDMNKNDVIGIRESFQILQEVEREDTVWSIVYDLLNSKLYFRTYCNKFIKIIDMKSIDFSEKTSSYVYDLENTNTNAFHMEFYSRELNRKNIENFYGNEVIRKMMHLPDAAFVIDAFDQHIQRIEQSNDDLSPMSTCKII